jgi:hypothetical protein
MLTNARAAQAAAMAARVVDAEPATELLERRWFAAFAAVKSLQAECDVLLGVLELSGDEWRRACAQLAQLGALRDALGNQLAAMDEPRGVSRERYGDAVRGDVGGVMFCQSLDEHTDSGHTPLGSNEM